VSDLHLAEIACDLVDWEELAPDLGITDSEKKEIREDYEGVYNLQKRQALRIWRWKNDREDKATYRNLIHVCCNRRFVSLAERVSRCAVSSRERPRGSLVLNDTFYRYLLDCYSSDLSHPLIKQWPSKATHASIPWPHAYFDLLLYNAPLNIPVQTHSINDSCFKAVPLHDTLKKIEGANRLIVCFEGIAGCGKSTLSWYACREWAKKQMLQQFELLIHVPLSDPHVKKAKSLTDIIPYPDSLQRIIATEIVDRKGEGICLLLDGLDEAPTSLLDFLLIDLIQGSSRAPTVPNLSFIMTSRPDSRVTERLEPILISRVIIKGFSLENLHKFLDHSLGGDTTMRMKLTEKCEINPKIEGLCSLPINAVIISFLVHCIEGDMPATQTGLYKPFVSNFLLRHLDIRQTSEAKVERPLIECLLSDIPAVLHGAFYKVCSLAYLSSLEGKQLFTKEELGQKNIEIDNTLGLLQVHPQITMYGTKRYYRFFHLSLQEFLAAVHLSKRDRSGNIREILRKIPQSQVLPFYAGLTQLNNREALGVLSQALGQSVDHSTVAGQLSKFNDPRKKSLAFINCLYECQNRTLLERPEAQSVVNSSVQNAVADLNIEASKNFRPNAIPGGSQIRTLTLKHLPLSPIDCLSLGYYLCAQSCIPTCIPYEQILAFDLSSCSIDHIGLRVLFAELKRNIHQKTHRSVQLILAYNTLRHESLPYLKQLIEGQSNVRGLGLCQCFDHGPSVAYHCSVLKCLTEGLSNNSSCTFIDLSANCFQTSHIFYFVLILRACPQLSYLDFKGFDLHNKIVMSLFSSAVQCSHLKCLDLSSCIITNSILALLGRAISNHPSLSLLNIYYNLFDQAGLSNFLRNFVGNRFSRLTFVGTSLDTNRPELEQILEKIRHLRTLCQHPELILKSLYDSPYVDEISSSTLKLMTFDS
jgi:hypothetical protein